MMENELDMEDIESRLYSQVHHSSAEGEQPSNVPIPTEGPPQSIHSNPYTLSNVAKHPTHRYFHKEHIKQPLQPTYISFDDNINPLQKNISTSPASTDKDKTTESNFSNQFQNNITVNQYTSIPVIINTELNEVLNPPFAPKYFTSWAVQNQHLVGNKKKHLKKERNKEKQKQNKKDKVTGLIIGVNLNGDVQRSVNEVICVSDDSDDECIIQEIDLASPIDRGKLSTGFPKKYNDNDETSKKPESDDDIIFIPPPPIEVVNVDGDDKEEEIVESIEDASNSPNSAKKLSPSNPKPSQKELTPESSASNDFLDSTGIENSTHKFNFSLHGSDFNNSQAEFVRPANPVDFCETESSCSTNELNRDFNNSVKTVVFDEVEFPREDIFSENNLEKFGTYITPRRSRNKELCDNAVENSKNTETRDVVEVDSSTDSSSESDYEHSKCVNKNQRTSGLEAGKKLPTLSPMLSEGTEFTTPKRMKLKKKATSKLLKDQLSPKKDLSKKKLVVDISDTDSDTGKETPKSESKKLAKKKKKKMSARKRLETCSKIIVGSDSQRKRKKKHVLQNSEEDGDNLKKSQNKKKKGTSETNNSESGESTDECMSQKKRRKKSLLNEIKNLTDVLAVEITRLTNAEQLQAKKKSGSSESNNAQNEETIYLGVSSSRKKKKGSSESNNTQNEETTDLGVSSSQKKKRKNLQEPKTPQNDNIEASSMSEHQTEQTIRQESSETTRGRKKKVSSESNSGNEQNIEATRKKKRNRSGSKSPEKGHSFDSDVMVKKKKDQYLESVPVTEPECTNQEPVIEKPKKKKRKSEMENLETDDTAEDKQQRAWISFSELLNQQPVDLEDRIEAEVQKKKNKKASPTLDPPVLENTQNENTSSLTTKSNDLSQSEAGLSPQGKEKGTEENQQQSLDESILLNEIPVDCINQVESSAVEGAEENDSDEELIVVDDIPPYSPNLIVVDEAESTVINAEVVLSSDSEYDFQELNDVGKDLELANCVVQGGTNDDSEELIVVDDDSGDNLANRYSVDEDYRHFDVEAIQSTQTDDPEAWKISYKDRGLVSTRRHPGPRCNRCRQFGHPAVRCSEKVLPPNCSLCGNPGHEEPRCPNKICRQCGNEGDYSTSYCWKCFKFRNSKCRLCNMEGHIAKTCPDLWRRYHLTTKEGPLVVSQQPQLKPRDQLWCSGCAQRGHMEHECTYFREYPPINPSIVSYEDVLHQESANSSQRRFDKSSADCSRTNVSPGDTSTFCPQNLPQSLATHSAHCSPKDISSSQSRVPLLSGVSSSLADKEPSQSISPTNEDVHFFVTIPRYSAVSPSESQNVPSLRPDIAPPQSPAGSSPTSAVSSKPSTSIQVSKSNQLKSVNDINCELPIPANCLNFTEYDYDNLLLAANSGLLGHIRSIQFGESVASDNNLNQVQPVPAKMIEKSTRGIIKEDQYKIKRLLMHESVCVVREFLRKEMSELKCWVSKRDPQFLLRMYFKYNKLSLMREPLTTKTVSDKCFWFRILNMYLLGVHDLAKGKQRRHMRLLERFLTMNNPNKFCRVSLVQAHKRVFGADKHSDIDYPKLIQQIIDGT